MSTPFRLQVPSRIVRELVEQALSEAPNECCGLLAGQFLPDEPSPEGDGFRVGRVLRCYPLLNAARSPTRFLSDDRSMFNAVRDMRDRLLDVLAVYHSHPTSDPIPSRTDLADNYSSEVVNIIISLKNGEPLIRAWWLTAEDYREAWWEVVEDAQPH